MLLMLLLHLLPVLLQWLAWGGHVIHRMMDQIRQAVARLHAVLLALAIRLNLRKQRRRYWRMTETAAGEEARVIYRSRAKPEWVKNEVLRLKALMPHDGCRKIADCFNRCFEEARKMTVGKTYVSDMIRKHLYEIQVLRRQIKSAKPKKVPRNLIWALDLTGKTTLDGQTRLVLGIIEHASRTALTLETLHNKSSWTLIGKLAAAIKRYGKPRFVRTDNESIFTSHEFRFALFLLGIRHQTTDLHCPWQNGRVERFFGTLKERLDRLAVVSFDALNSALVEFRFFYNHVRPHQNLDGRTPAEAWARVNPHVTRFKREYWFEAWDGLLAGYYLRR
jgi:transposase InsO family protein